MNMNYYFMAYNYIYDITNTYMNNNININVLDLVENWTFNFYIS